MIWLCRILVANTHQTPTWIVRFMQTKVEEEKEKKWVASEEFISYAYVNVNNNNISSGFYGYALYVFIVLYQQSCSVCGGGQLAFVWRTSSKCCLLSMRIACDNHLWIHFIFFWLFYFCVCV